MALIVLLFHLLTVGQCPAEATGTSVILATAPAFIPLRSSAKNADVAFSTSNYAFPGEIEPPVLGDINNDGRDELLVFLHYRRDTTEEGASGVEFALAIYTIEPKGLKLLWTDNGDFEYGCCSDIATGSDDMLGVGDIDGSGKNKLFVWLSVSDVSFPYSLLVWKDGRLEKESTWNFINQISSIPSATTGTPLSGQVQELALVKTGGRRVLKGTFIAVPGIGASEKEYERAEKKEIYGFIRDGRFEVDASEHQ